MTVARGASPAEAATAACLARRLIGQLAHRNHSGAAAPPVRRGALAPGVHVDVVSRRRLHTAGC